jgi:hypothetical protein
MLEVAAASPVVEGKIVFLPVAEHVEALEGVSLFPSVLMLYQSYPS